MKKATFIFAMMMLLSSTCISTFANNPKDAPMPITGVLNIPIHKSPHMSYIIDSMDSRVCSLTFTRALDNAEIRIYLNDIF